jgi:hypothetical protein
VLKRGVSGQPHRIRNKDRPGQTGQCDRRGNSGPEVLPRRRRPMIFQGLHWSLTDLSHNVTMSTVHLVSILSARSNALLRHKNADSKAGICSTMRLTRQCVADCVFLVPCDRLCEALGEHSSLSDSYLLNVSPRCPVTFAKKRRSFVANHGVGLKTFPGSIQLRKSCDAHHPPAQNQNHVRCPVLDKC